jgi:hypothetical protein
MTNSWKPIGDAAARVIDELSRKRADLALLRARYDSGAVSAAIYVVIKRIECDIAWNEHKPERTHRNERTAP